LLLLLGGGVEKNMQFGMGEDLGMPIALCFSSIRVLTQTLLSSPLPTSFLTAIGNCCGPLPLLFGGPVTGAFL